MICTRLLGLVGLVKVVKVLFWDFEASVLHYIAREWRMLPCWVLGYEAIQHSKFQKKPGAPRAHTEPVLRHPTPDIWSSWRMEAKNKLQSQYISVPCYFHLLSNDWPWLAIACYNNTIDIWMFIWGQTTSSSVQCWRSSELCLAGEELRLFDWSWSLDFQLNSSELFRTLQNSSELFDWRILTSSK